MITAGQDRTSDRGGPVLACVPMLCVLCCGL